MNLTGAVNLSTPDMDDLPRHAYAKQDKDYPVVQWGFDVLSPVPSGRVTTRKLPLHNGVIVVLLSIRALQKVIDLRGGQVDRPLKVRGSRVHDLV